MPPTIVSVGALTFDWLETAAGRIGPFPAGNALYSAAGVWLAAGDPIIVARVGGDYPVDRIAAAGLSTAHIRRVAGNSFRVLLAEGAHGRELSYLNGSGTNLDLDPNPAELPPGSLTGVHVGPGQPSTQRAMLAESRRRGCRTTLDMLFVGDAVAPTRDDFLDLASRANAFLPSLADLRRLWPGIAPEAGLRLLIDAGCAAVVVKMGASGCIGSDGRGLVHVPAIPARLVDSTGAGDAYCGAFLTRWIETGDFVGAMIWGAAAASVVIEDYGALHAIKEGARLTTSARFAAAAKLAHEGRP
jgi:sugar/nucleoside kinase (ribokinase family)